ncbi:MAG TPA: CDP-glycerol glycerophosphotransferase family protein [Clostridiales bacterium]|nr:CDP-glycerol glycerophosphotransferase family protein [Clostridiales bacterium]
MYNQDMENKIKTIKLRIESLINSGRFMEAMRALAKLDENMPNDPDVCSMMAVIHIVEGKLDKAEEAINRGLVKDTVQFDLLFNLAYIYELKNELEKALDLYLRAESAARNADHRQNVRSAIERIRSIDDSITVTPKKKIVFFVKDGMNNFFEDILVKLEGEYWTRKISVSDLSQIEEGIEWADICWFEWCDELIVNASRIPAARNKKIICRLHRYEAFTQYPANVVWESVDKLIVVTPHLKELLEMNFPGISKRVDIAVIENGVDLEKFSYKKRDKGFNVAMIGYIHSRKNPVMLLQIINKLVKTDSRYKLYIAGHFQDKLIKLYWEYQIERMGLTDNVIFDGWQEDISSWLEDKNYLLSTSIHESFGYGIAEAMARGVKPVIHDFLYADEIWDKNFLYNTVDEAVNMILDDDYCSETYRDYIKNRFSLDDKVNTIKKLLNELMEQPSQEESSGNQTTAPVSPRRKLITLVYRTYCGSNTVALYKLVPEKLADEYDIRLVVQNSSDDFYNLIGASNMIVTTHGCIKSRRDQISAELWHGIPLKTIGDMVNDINDESRKTHNYWWSKADVVTSYSQTYSTLMNACVNIGGHKFVITGAPRNDLLLTSDGRKKLSELTDIDLTGKKILFFLPTFRTTFYGRYDGNKEWDNIFGMKDFDIIEFDKFLEDNNILMVAKLHPNEEYKILNQIEGKVTKNTILIRNSDLEENRTDLYEILNSADVLITDYSSVYFDFLLLDRPMIFTPVDLGSYRELRGLLLEPFDFWTPGPKALDQKTLEREILHCLSGNSHYANERKTIRDIMHHYQDANSGKRVWDMLIKMLN